MVVQNSSIGIAGSQLLSQLLQRLGVDGSSSLLLSSIAIPLLVDNSDTLFSKVMMLLEIEYLLCFGVGFILYSYRRLFSRKTISFLEKIGLMRKVVKIIIDEGPTISSFFLFKKENPSLFEESSNISIGNSKNSVNEYCIDPVLSPMCLSSPEPEGIISIFDFDLSGSKLLDLLPEKSRENTHYQGSYVISKKEVTKKKFLNNEKGALESSLPFEVFILNISLTKGSGEILLSLLSSFAEQHERKTRKRSHLSGKYERKSKRVRVKETPLPPFCGRGRSEIYDSLFGRKLKSVFEKCCDVFRNPEKYYSRGGARTSVLLYGPPGTGKSMIVNRLSEELNLHVAEIDFLSLTPEEAHSCVRELNLHPCSEFILHLGEIDILIEELIRREERVKISEKNLYFSTVSRSKRSSRDSDDDDEEEIPSDRKKILFSNLLEIFQGAIPCHGAIVIATTNHYEKMMKIPGYEERVEALFRDGRMTPVKIDYVSSETLDEITSFYFGKTVGENLFSGDFKKFGISSSNIIRLVNESDDVFKIFVEKLREFISLGE